MSLYDILGDSLPLSSAGFVGLFDAVLLLPLVMIWHLTGIELFEVPSNSVWTLLLVNGFIGTVLSELFWLWCVCSSVPVCLDERKKYD